MQQPTAAHGLGNTARPRVSSQVRPCSLTHRGTFPAGSRIRCGRFGGRGRGVATEKGWSDFSQGLYDSSGRLGGLACTVTFQRPLAPLPIQRMFPRSARYQSRR